MSHGWPFAMSSRSSSTGERIEVGVSLPQQSFRSDVVVRVRELTADRYTEEEIQAGIDGLEAPSDFDINAVQGYRFAYRVVARLDMLHALPPSCPQPSRDRHSSG